MKQFIIPGLLAILLAACNNENGGSKGSKSEAEKKVSKRDYSINVFGNISGSYTVSGNQLDIVIDDKPMMIPCSAIENVLKSQIGG